MTRSIKFYQYDRDGTASYHMFLMLDSESGMATLVRRWGKIGSAGQIKRQRGTVSAMRAELEKEQEKRHGRGYSCVYSGASLDEHNSIRSGLEEIKRAAGDIGFWNKNDQLRSLIQSHLLFKDPAPDDEKIERPAEIDAEIDRGDAWGSW